MENARQLQCKALHRLQKIRRCKNNGKQWKKQCAEQWRQWEIRARADSDIPKKLPIAERRRAHTSKTRISAIAHPSVERTSKKRSRYSRRAAKDARDTHSYAMVPASPRGSAHDIPFGVACFAAH